MLSDKNLFKVGTKFQFKENSFNKNNNPIYQIVYKNSKYSYCECTKLNNTNNLNKSHLSFPSTIYLDKYQLDYIEPIKSKKV